MSRLKMKRVLLTGAAQGIGKVMAERFARVGAELVITDIKAEELEATRAELEAGGTRCRAYVLDVTDVDAVHEVRDAIHRDMGNIDILVNNAGVVFGGPFLEVPIRQHQLTYRINTEGPVVMTHAFLPDLLASPAGHLVYIASASGFVGLPNGTTYASSKWAAIGFAESIRAELSHQGHKNVDVTTVCPGYINTGMFDGVEPPKTMDFLEPGFIADKVVEAVEKRQVWVLEPWLAKITPVLKHCLPTQLSDFLSVAFGANRSMDEWSGHGRSGRPGANS